MNPEITSKLENGVLTVFLSGRIDSTNAAEAEQEIAFLRTGSEHDSLIVDCAKLEYVSSAGLRIFLRLRKAYPDMKIVNVSSEVYEILDITGFTEMIEVEKAYRTLSVEGCEVIGRGANGEVYRIDRDTIVKVYLNPDSLPDIQRERELARKAFVLGIPTAIPYDVVRVGNGYGSVFELLNARSFASLLAEDPGNLDEVVEMSVDLLKKIHATELNPGEMPDMKETAVGWADFLKPYLPAEESEKLCRLMREVPEDRHMMHGDFHLKNIMLQNGEALLIDMDTLCMGHPIFEFGSIFNAYIGFASVNREQAYRFLELDSEMRDALWDWTLRLYFEGESEEKIRSVRDKAALVGYTRIMRRSIRRTGLDNEQGKAEVEICRRNISELLKKVDTLVY